MKSEKRRARKNENARAEESGDKKTSLNRLFFGISLAVICLMLLFTAAGVASATTYYVRTDGNDSCSGLQNVSYAENPTDCAWRTITHALAAIIAGDTVRVQLGTYNEEPELTHSGTESQPINIIGDGNPILDGEGIKENGFYALGKEYFTISGFTIQNYAKRGVYVISYGGIHGISITDCTFRDITEQGIFFDAVGEPTVSYENILIKNNSFSNIGNSWLHQTIYLPGNNNTISYNTIQNTYNYANGIVFGGESNIVEYNHLENIAGNGIDTAGGHNNIVRNNYIHCNRRGIRWDFHGSDNKILNNEITKSPEAAMEIYPFNDRFLIAGNKIHETNLRYEGGTDTIIENNYFYPGTWFTVSGAYQDGQSYAEGLIFRNNFMKDCWLVEIGGFVYNMTIENNIFINLYSGNGGIFFGYPPSEPVPPEEWRYGMTIKNNVFYSIPYNAIDISHPFRDIVIKNNIFEEVNGYCVYNRYGENVNVSYNDIWNCSSPYFDGVTDTNTLEKKPLFVDPLSDDFHLKSQYGRWNGTKWVSDDVTSSCIDAGDPADDYSKEPISNGGRINMGAYGNTVEASMSPGENMNIVVAIPPLTVPPGDTITVPIIVYNVTDLGAGTLNVTYNSSVCTVINVTTGDFPMLSKNISVPGIARISALDTSGHTGDVTFAYLEIKAIGSCGQTSPLNISVETLWTFGPPPGSIPATYITVSNGTFTIPDTVEPSVTNPLATSATILNDNGRPRVPGTNISQLNVTVTDNIEVAMVTIDLSPIGGSSEQPMTRIPGTNIWTITVKATAGINLTHNLIINATDSSGNFNNSISVPLTVLRRGDVIRDNKVDIGDALYIAQYTAGLVPNPDELVGDVLPATGDGVIDIEDALYIGQYTVGIVPEP